VQTQAKPLASLDLQSTDDTDLAFLGPLLQGRRLVALGESGHGVAEFSQAKVRLIKYLHEQLGYDVLAFESSILSCYRGEARATTLDAQSLMQDSVFGIWSTQDVEKLFAYLKETQATAHPLILAGFDVQLTTPDEMQNRPAIFQEVVGKVDAVYAQQVHDMDAAFIQGMKSLTYLEANRDALKVAYANLTDFLDAHMPALEQAFPDRPLYPQVVRQAAWGMSAFLDELYAYYIGDEATSNAVRDAGMATNLEVLMDTLYPGKKVIAWAHNDHLMHDESAAINLSPSFKNMGKWIEDRYGASVYTVGLFMYQGAAADNGRNVYDIAPAGADTMEGLLHAAGYPALFMDLSQAGTGDGTTWMDSSMGARDWGTRPFYMKPRAQFDGILQIDTVHPPSYVPYPAGTLMSFKPLGR
jgi:erythromycin esterase